MDFYRIDSRKITLREYWRISKFGFPLAALLKILRIPLGIKTAIPYPTQAIVSDENELNLDGRLQRLHHEMSILRQEKYRFQFTYREPVIDPETETLGIAFLSEDGLVYCLLADTVTRVGVQTRRRKILSLATRLSDGSFLCTSSAGFFNSPPEFKSEVFNGGIQGLLRRHRRRLTETRLAEVQKISAVEIPELIVELANRAAEFQISRGLYIKMLPEQLNKAKNATPRRKLWFAKLLVINLVIYYAIKSLLGLGLFDFGLSAPKDRSEMVWADKNPVDFNCETADDNADSAWSTPLVATLWARFDSKEATHQALEEIRNEMPLSESVSDYMIESIGSGVFIRISEGDVKRFRPVYEKWKSEAEEVGLNRVDSQSSNWSARITWETKEPDSPSEISDYLTLGFSAKLIPPWAGPTTGRFLTEEEKAARRSVRLLQNKGWSADDFSLLDGIRGFLSIFTSDDEAMMKRYREQHRLVLERLRAIADELVANDPGLNRDAMEAYIATQDWGSEVFAEEAQEVDPFEDPVEEDFGVHQSTKKESALLAYLGAYDYRIDEETKMIHVEDPRSSLGIQWGWMTSVEDDVDLNLLISDPAISLPAVLQLICSEGGSQIRFEVSQDEDLNHMY